MAEHIIIFHKILFPGSLKGFTRINNEKQSFCYLAASSPFQHRVHGDHTSPSNLPLPHCLLCILTGNKTILLPELSSPLCQSFVYTENRCLWIHLCEYTAPGPCCFICSNMGRILLLENTDEKSFTTQGKVINTEKGSRKQLLCDALTHASCTIACQVWHNCRKK